MVPDRLVIPPYKASADPDAASFSPELARSFIEEYTAPGDLVLDPFAGSGTTLVVAEALDRRGFGIEILPEVAERARGKLRDPASLVTGDARRLRELAPTGVALILTSPPYMTVTDHPQDPLTGYRELGADYARYLDELTKVFLDATALLRDGGVAVVNVADFKHGAIWTPLATDLRTRLDAEPAIRVDREVLVESPDTPTDCRDVCFVLRRM